MGSRKTTNASVSDEIAGAVLHIEPLERAVLTFYLVGETPLIMNRMSEKARRQLMLPDLPKNQIEKQLNLKHNPVEEFRSSAYKSMRTTDRTYLHMPGGSFKSAIAKAATDIPGATKAAVGRLVSMAFDTIDIWGLPVIKFDMVRQAGIARTPDTRFRCCIPRWCCEVQVRFVKTLVPARSIVNLIDAAGLIRGVGDFRTEKGAGDFGQFRIVTGPDDPEFAQIFAEGGRDAQVNAMAHPEPYDDETQEMLTYWTDEVTRRRSMPSEPPKRERKNGKEAQEAIQ